MIIHHGLRGLTRHKLFHLLPFEGVLAALIIAIQILVLDAIGRAKSRYYTEFDMCFNWFNAPDVPLLEAIRFIAILIEVSFRL
jgi:hypothetical protein